VAAGAQSKADDTSCALEGDEATDRGEEEEDDDVGGGGGGGDGRTSIAV
jgi:hypothetical protein